MRKSRFTEAQIVAIVAECDAGASPKELARKHGIHINTLRLWKSNYSGMGVSDVVCLLIADSVPKRIRYAVFFEKRLQRIRAVSGEAAPQRV